MKRLNLVLALLLLLCAAAFAAPPAPPRMGGIVGTPTNGFWLTNITFVFTNTAIRTPTVDLGQVTVYGTNTFSQANVLAWALPTNMVGVAGFSVYYAKTSGGTTNKFTVKTNITSAAFYSSLTTNVSWWAYVTSFDTNSPPLESAPSSAVTFTPTK